MGGEEDEKDGGDLAEEGGAGRENKRDNETI